MVNLASIIRRLIKIELNQPLHIVGSNEVYRLSEKSDAPRIPTVREVVGYLTRYRVSSLETGDGNYLVVNPFGSNNVILNEEQQRAGDISIDLKYIERMYCIDNPPI